MFINGLTAFQWFHGFHSSPTAGTGSPSGSDRSGCSWALRSVRIGNCFYHISSLMSFHSDSDCWPPKRALSRPMSPVMGFQAQSQRNGCSGRKGQLSGWGEWSGDGPRRWFRCSTWVVGRAPVAPNTALVAGNRFQSVWPFRKENNVNLVMNNMLAWLVIHQLKRSWANIGNVG